MKKNCILFSLSLLVIAFSYSQENNVRTNFSRNDTVETLLSLNEIIKTLGVPKTVPVFPGNIDLYLAANAKYPEASLKAGIQGRVVAQFWIEEDGSISDIQITKGIEPKLDSEVVRVIQKMPKWTPSKIKGLPVREKRTLPVNFKIEIPEVNTEKTDEMPSFKGRVDDYFDNHLKYPGVVPKAGIQGRVVCRFMVNNDGSISDVNVIHGIVPSLDEEVARVIQQMPKWNPGKRQGQPVHTKYILSVYFQLNNPNINVVGLFSSDVTYTISADTEVMPVFKGGNVTTYLNNFVKYPREVQEAGIEGRVICQFTVDIDGSISDIQVVRKINPDLDAEAVRVIQHMPKWIPGMQNGEPVRVTYTLPVNFKLTRQSDSDYNYNNINTLNKNRYGTYD